MISPTVMSLAVLKANWDTFQKDYYENFVPMVAECIRLSDMEIVATGELQDRLRSDFGISLPQHVIESLLKRLRKRQYVSAAGGVLRPNREELAKLDFRNQRDYFAAGYAQIIDNLVEFCETSHNVMWTREDAENAVLDYIDEDELGISGLGRSVIPDQGVAPQSATFLVGDFISSLDESSADFKFFEKVIEGVMLANAIFLPNPGSVERRFSRTSVYFDTSFLLYVLGYVGPSQQRPRRELLSLLTEAGAELKCFSHTFHELKSILDGAAKALSSADTRPRKTFASVLDYFIVTGQSASDVMLKAISLEDDLNALGIKVQEKPLLKEIRMNDSLLKKELGERIGYRNPRSLARDVESVLGILQLRQWEEHTVLEECGAIFVSTNHLLVETVQKVFYVEVQDDTVAPCITDAALTNLLWLKRPTELPELPRKKIIATCWAATQPNEVLMERYVTEITSLRKKGGITEESYYVLRASLEAKESLMEVTLGEDEALSLGRVHEILERVHQKMRAEDEARAEVERREADARTEAQRREADEAHRQRERAEAAREAAENEVRRLIRDQHEAISASAASFARRVRKVIMGVAFVLLLGGSLAVYSWGTPGPTLGEIALFAVGPLLVVLGVVDLIWGGLLDNALGRVERRVERAWEEHLLHAFRPPRLPSQDENP